MNETTLALQRQQLLQAGYVVLENLVSSEELKVLQAETALLLERAQPSDGRDFRFYRSSQNNQLILWKVDYILDKVSSCRALSAHPRLLEAVRTVLGPNFILGWESMAVKMPDEGIICNWHRDFDKGFDARRPLFQAGIYLDNADLDSCLWVIPGSHLWSPDEIKRKLETLGRGDNEYDALHDQDLPFVTPSDAIPIRANAGDVILHVLSILHGSPRTVSPSMRRTVYFDYRPIELELESGPHIPAFIPLKQKMLLRCIETRKKTTYAKDEEPYNYKPNTPFPITLEDDLREEQYKVEHEEFFR